MVGTRFRLDFYDISTCRGIGSGCGPLDVCTISVVANTQATGSTYLALWIHLAYLPGKWEGTFLSLFMSISRQFLWFQGYLKISESSFSLESLRENIPTANWFFKQIKSVMLTVGPQRKRHQRPWVPGCILPL